MMPSTLTRAAATTCCTFLVPLLLLVLEAHTAAAYQPADGPGQVCRPLRLDETAWTLPGAAGDLLPAVPLVEEKDLWPCGSSAVVVSEGATLRLEAWGGVSAKRGRCFPNALILAAGTDRLRIPLPRLLMD